jgi:hypothetical protein
MRHVWIILGCLTWLLMASPAKAATPHSEFVGYPGLAKYAGQIDVYDDKGLVVELVVNCGRGRFGILTYSKSEQLYCGPDQRCLSSLGQAIGRLCR